VKRHAPTAHPERAAAHTQLALIDRCSCLDVERTAGRSVAGNSSETLRPAASRRPTTCGIPSPTLWIPGGFLYQLVEGHAGLTSAGANAGGVAFFAHVGGFAFGALVTLALRNAGRLVPQSSGQRTALAPL
jgi:hypothetical protein